MRKNIFVILLIFLTVFSASCSNGNKQSVGMNTDNADDGNKPISVIKEKLTFADYTKTDDYVTLGEDNYAVRFTADTRLHSLDLHAFNSEGMCRAVITLYNWRDDYETTIATEPFDTYTLGPLSAQGNGIIQAMSFPSVKTPPAGEYLLLISLSNKNGTLLLGELTAEAKESGVTAYKNGVEYDKTPCMTMAYYIG